MEEVRGGRRYQSKTRRGNRSMRHTRNTTETIRISRRATKSGWSARSRIGRNGKSDDHRARREEEWEE